MATNLFTSTQTSELTHLLKIALGISDSNISSYSQDQGWDIQRDGQGGLIITRRGSGESTTLGQQGNQTTRESNLYNR